MTRSKAVRLYSSGDNMGNENLHADMIYEFWRWEYLRRNEEYRAHYDLMAQYLNRIGITGFRYIDIEEFAAKEISFLDCLEVEDEFSPEYRFDVLYWLLDTIDKFKVFPPPSPSHGLNSQEILEKFVREKVDDTYQINYKQLPKADYIPFPLSSIIKKADIPSSEQQPDPLSEMNAKFLSQNPSFKAQSETFQRRIDAFFRNRVQDKGKYDVLAGAPEKIIMRDRKLLVALEKYAKSFSSTDYRKFDNERRNKIRETLKLRGKRIKHENLRRAMGLFLWDQKTSNSVSLSNATATLQSELNHFENYPELPSDDILKRLVRQTSLCISEKEVMPLSPPQK